MNATINAGSVNNLMYSLWKDYVADQPPIVAHGTNLIVLYIIFFWGFNLPFILLQFRLAPKFILEWTDKYKLNAAKSPTNAEWWNTFWGVVKIHILFVFPFTLVNAYFTPQHLQMRTDLESFPNIYQIVIQLIATALIHDFVFGGLHLLFHKSKFLYRTFHSIHHKIRYTTSIASNYFHPIDYLVAAPIPTFAGPSLMGSHAVVFYIFMIINLYETTIAHSGYDLPYTFFDGKDHAFHHSHIDSMYGSFFLIMDKLLGTDKKFKEHLARQEKKKLAEKSQ